LVAAVPFAPDFSLIKTSSERYVVGRMGIKIRCS